MRNLRSLVAFTALVASACAAADAPPAPDAGIVAPVAIDPAGRFLVRSALSLPVPDGEVNAALHELAAATDGPDDPSRYLIDLIVDRLGEGRIKDYARQLAPWLATYVNEHLATVAPRLAPGIRSLVDGFGRIARRMSTLEDVRIAIGGRARRTIEGLSFEATEVWFAPLGLPDITVNLEVALAGDQLAIAGHALAVPYARVLRLGLDHAVIPGVVPGAGDLAEALHALVDCARLGELVARRIGLGSPALYGNACRVGLTAAAARIYGALPAPDGPAITLQVSGTARALDRDGDREMDAIEDGMWIGTFGTAPLGVATFTGAAR